MVVPVCNSMANVKLEKVAENSWSQGDPLSGAGDTGTAGGWEEVPQFGCARLPLP